MKKIIFSISVITGLLYLGICAYLSIIQTSLIFFPSKLHQDNIALARDNKINLEDIAIQAEPGILLKGWLKSGSSSSAPKKSLIIYFGGNGDEVSSMLPLNPEILNGWSMALVNYRGYGESDGEPNEKNLFADALKVYDYFAARPDIDQDHIVLMGRSLGSGVASYLAAQRPVCKVVLVSPYSSLRDIAQHEFPVFPVDLILRNKFPSCSYARSLKIPMFYVVGENDGIIPPKYSEKLAGCWQGPSAEYIVPDAGHNDLLSDGSAWRKIIDALGVCR